MPSTTAPPALAAPVASAGPAAPRARGGTEALVVAGWLALVLAALVTGRHLIAGHGLGIDAAPLTGHWIWRPRWALIAPAMLAAAVVAVGPRWASRARWSHLLVASGVGASAWATGLAASDGWSALTRPLTTRHEYEPFAAGITDTSRFLRTFVTELPGYPIHVQGHPPGAALVPRLLDGLALDGAGWFAVLCLAGWGVAVAAALVAARTVAGEGSARRAAPALVLLPAALWAGTSVDALFAGVLAVGVAVAVGSMQRAGERWRALGGGAVLGGGLLLTYGGVLLLAIPAAVSVHRRRPDLLLLVGAGALAVLLAVAGLSGFWWGDGLGATHRAYVAGVAEERPDAWFALLGNPSALALAVGPAVAVGLAAAGARVGGRAALLSLAALAAVVVADASLLSKGEVERIWLPFVPWLALAAPGDRRGWLAAQAALALLLQAWLRSKW